MTSDALPDLRTRISAVAHGDTRVWTPPPIRAAATVALVRPGPQGVEVYVIRRVRTMAFAPTMHVFPGGAVEATDGELGSAQAFRVAAVREVAEETGVALADPSELVPFARWVTPAVETRRYDTVFFAVAAPAGEAPSLVGTEASHSVWIRPELALAEHAEGRMAMLPPTIATLHQLSGFPDQASLLTGVASLPQPHLMPVPVAVGEEIQWTLRDEATGNLILDPTQAGLPADWSMGLG